MIELTHSVDIVYAFGILCLVLIIPYGYLSGDIYVLFAHCRGDYGADFLFNYAINCLTCLTHTYLTLFTVTIAGPDGINIAGTLKDVFLTYVGFLYFKDV